MGVFCKRIQCGVCFGLSDLVLGVENYVEKWELGRDLLCGKVGRRSELVVFGSL